MSESSVSSRSTHSVGLTFLAVINSVALAVTVLFRAMLFLRRPVPLAGRPTSLPDRANASVTQEFGIDG